MPPEQCSSHLMFEKMMMTAIDNLADKITEGISAITTASLGNDRQLKQVLDSLSTRNELCGQRGAKIDGLASSDLTQWRAIDDLRKKIYVGMGVVVALQMAVPLIAHFMLKG